MGIYCTYVNVERVSLLSLLWCTAGPRSRENFSDYLEYPWILKREKNSTILILSAWFPQPTKFYFPGHNYHFSGQSIQDLKVINQDMCKNAYI